MVPPKLILRFFSELSQGFHEIFVSIFNFTRFFNTSSFLGKNAAIFWISSLVRLFLKTPLFLNNMRNINLTSLKNIHSQQTDIISKKNFQNSDHAFSFFCFKKFQQCSPFFHPLCWSSADALLCTFKAFCWECLQYYLLFLADASFHWSKNICLYFSNNVSNISQYSK